LQEGLIKAETYLMLYMSLIKVYQNYINNADKLARLIYANGKENLNQMKAKQAPKITALFRLR
jgi:hypothetical protein